MKRIINKIIVSSFFVFGLFLINTNNSSAYVTYTNHNENINYTQQYVTVAPAYNYDVNTLPMCDSTYKLLCPYNVYCRNINGMTAFACPAAYANQPANTNYANNYNNNSQVQSNSSYYNNQNYINTNYKFVNSPVYYENGVYYTNPVIRPSYDIAPTYNQANNYYYSY